MQRSRILTGLIVAALASVFASQVASCTLDVEGTKPPVTTGDPCTVDANCDDGNPCTTEICPPTTLVCEYTKQMSGDAPTSAQTPEDCSTIVCKDGEPSTVADPQDFNNDNNSCTTDACVAGMPTNEVLADDTTCTQGTKSGQCKAGTCTITCMNNNDCNDGNPCKEAFCNTGSGTCVFTNLDGVPTPGVTPVVGDCKLHICDNGVDTEINDDADIKDDNNPCTFDVCNVGMPENNNVPEATACTPGDVKVCDGAGACVDCTTASHCVGITETECEKRSCVNKTCQIAYEGQTTLANATLQTPNDCNKIVCNGNMGTIKVPDDADVPADGNNCTKDICTNGLPTNPPEPQDLGCGASQVCDGAGKCVGCTTASQCAGMDDFCKTRTCISNVCGFSYTANGTDLPTGQTDKDCKILECDGMGNVKTSADQTDKPVDGNACTQDLCSGQGNPSNPATPINSPCSVGANNACDGLGTCKKSQGTTCGAGNECVTANCVDGYCCNSTCTTLCRSCDVAGKLGTCSDVPKGTDDGTCTGATMSCNAANDCDSEIGQPCAANTSCLSTFCADGVCCDTACGAACKSCGVAGSIGTCSNIPAGSQDNAPTNLCVGSSQCDGNGICKKVPGTMCTGNTECLSGNCVDGVCCNTACNTDCQACNLSASMGTCSNVAMGNDDGACSGATKSCDGMGGCKIEQGGPCAAGTDCFSTFCVDSVCCNNACSGLCNACTNAKTGMTTGSCNPVTGGSDPDGECAPDMVSTCGLNGSCDGAGACQKYAAMTPCSMQSCSGSTQTNANQCNGNGTCVVSGTTDCAPYVCGAMACKMTCAGDGDCTSGNFCAAPNCVGKKANGQNCGGGNQCTSGNCVDGVCCSAMSCTTTCQSCNVAGMAGSCQNIPQGMQDVGTCDGTMACDGGSGNGACKLKSGQGCSNNNQCASGTCKADNTCQ